MAKRKRIRKKLKDTREPDKVEFKVFAEKVEDGEERYYGEVWIDAGGRKGVVVHQDPRLRLRQPTVEQALEKWAMSNKGQKAIRKEVASIKKERNRPHVRQEPDS